MSIVHYVRSYRQQSDWRFFLPRIMKWNPFATRLWITRKITGDRRLYCARKKRLNREFVTFTERCRREINRNANVDRKRTERNAQIVLNLFFWRNNTIVAICKFEPVAGADAYTRESIVTGNWHDTTLQDAICYRYVDYSIRFGTRGVCHFELLFGRLQRHHLKRSRHVLTVSLFVSSPCSRNSDCGDWCKNQFNRTLLLRSTMSRLSEFHSTFLPHIYVINTM